ncbi:MAG TPA: sirohydrochlorin chelatase [Mycobacterium sp.]|nr:sirohydrochlorin chelatase [Mycobacterium sp.]
MRMILAAHGSADPRSATVTHAVAAQLRTLRPGLDVRVGFCEQNAPNLRDVLGAVRVSAVVTPLLLASAYHARVDIPGLIEQSGADVLQADTLGEDPRLVEVMRQRLAEADVAAGDPHLGVLVVAVGSSRPEANARTATVADALAHNTRWCGVAVAHAAGPRPSVAAGIDALRQRGARRIILAPWFIAPGRITDRVAEIGRGAGVRMAAPLGAHALLAETLLDRFDQAVAARAAA